MSAEQVLERARNCVEQAFEHRLLGSRLRDLEIERLAQLLVEWMDLERTRAPFRVVERETPQPVEIGGVRIKTRIDRVDELENGRHVIVDYKANAPSPNAWDSDRPAEPQVPLYATQHKGHVAGVLFGNLRPGELKFAGHMESKDLIPGVHCDPNLQERIESWRSVLTNLGAAYAAGRAEVDPKTGSTCDLCGLTALCRIREIHIAEESGDA